MKATYNRETNRYEIELRHLELHKYRHITGRDLYVVESKAEAQIAQWDDMWTRRRNQLDQQRTRMELMAQKDAASKTKKSQAEAKKDHAAIRTQEAEKELDQMRSILKATLTVDDTIRWDLLKNMTSFAEPVPAKPVVPQLTPQPIKQAAKDAPKLNFFTKLLPGAIRKREEAVKAQYQRDLSKWTGYKRKLKRDYEMKVQQYRQVAADWKTRKAAFIKNQKLHNDAIEKDRTAYLKGDSDAIIDYCELVLMNSTYHNAFPKDFDINYVADGRTLIIDYLLPNPEQLPTLQSVRYIQIRDEFVEKELSEREKSALYDSVLYQICLRTIHEMFEADVIDALEMVTFNGWVNSIDPGTGKETSGCILSLQTTKSEFMDIDLSHVEPKACFKKLKGIGSSKLHSLAPVAPLANIQRDDARFVPPRNIKENLADSENIAAMDWEDFEHLVRELFEKEFAANGGEVRVTQASRDGGVDAIAFDPDPLRGGKIVIQAKRYTKTVGVSAVRDLYGTVVHERALKGILVSTADFGPDAYNFAKDKPLTLLSGNNLLNLLSKHGYKSVNIDLADAREQLGLSKKSSPKKLS